MSASNGGRIAVVDEFGEHLMWADDERARELVKAGEARPIRRKGSVRVLQAAAGWTKPGEADLAGRGTALDHVRYSHRHETPTNPPRVWTFYRFALA